MTSFSCNSGGISCSIVCWFGGLSSVSRAAAVAAVAAVVVALAWMACSAAVVSASTVVSSGRCFQNVGL